MPRRLALLLAACLAAPGVRADGPDPVAADEAVLRTAGLPSDAAGLLTFLRLRAKGGAAPEEVAALVQRLDSPDAAGRARAAAELIGIGPGALPALRALARDPDSPGAAPARRCLRALQNDSAVLTAAALRLTAARRPEGAAAALLALLPHAEDDGVAEEAVAALGAVAVRGGKADPALVDALADPVALRRAAAVDVLLRTAPGERPAAAKLLQDPVPAVRLRAALATARAGEGAAVPVLIALLTELPPPATQAEEFLRNVAGDRAPAPPAPGDAEARTRYRDAWAAWWRGTEDPAPALDEVRKRTRGDADQEKGKALVRGLGDDSFEVRQKSAEALRAMGPPVVPLLRQAAGHPDLEVRQRAEAILHEVEGQASTPLSPSVLRVLALRKPAGVAAVLLAYLPSADDDVILAEAQEALDAVAFRDGVADPAVLKALGDKVAARRAAAAEALAQGPDAAAREAVRKLLGDPDPSVRVKAALALAYARDRAAVPALIALAGEAGDAAAAAEDYLTHLAGDRLPPAVAAAGGAAGRERRREAWAAWWRDAGEAVEFPGRPASGLPAPRYLGYTLLVEPQAGRVCELDAAGKTRWEITGLVSPQDAQVLPGDRVLIAESGARPRVTERNLKGEVLWERALTGLPVSARRLPGGHTLLVTRNRVYEVDRAGREVFALNRPGNDIMNAHRRPDGRVALVTSQPAFLVLDTAGREQKSFPLQGVSGFGNEALPRGGVLVPLSWQNKVMEYDAQGKVVWEAPVPQPTSACRLPDGHTLVSSQQWPPKVIELDRQGKHVAEFTATTQVHRATRR